MRLIKTVQKVHDLEGYRYTDEFDPPVDFATLLFVEWGDGQIAITWQVPTPIGKTKEDIRAARGL